MPERVNLRAVEKSVDLQSAISFTATHARLLDRRRFQLLLGSGEASAVLSALEAHRNAEGGYGWGLEPDLRATESQPGGALHAFEVFEEVAPLSTPRAAELCDWLASVTLGDGGLPFALPVADSAGVAPFWAEADPTQSSLQITSLVAAVAQRVASSDSRVANHAWLHRATRFCLDRIAALNSAPHALEMLGSLWLLDAVHDREPDAASLLELLGRFLGPSGEMHVAGGKPDETIRPLDFAPLPDRPVRGLFSPEVIATELQRLRDEQRPDGGWEVDFASYSPAAALEWRGYTTVRAISILRRNGYI
jgi:hypothetical protein